MAAIELWTHGAGMPSAFARRARRAEANGGDGITIVDSQNLSGDCMQGIHDAYYMTTHNRSGSAQAAVLTGEFAREYGTFGPADSCVERLAGLVALGLTRLVIVGPSRDAERAEVDRAEPRFLEAVAPALRKASG